MTYKPLKERTHEIELDWPFELDGVEYRTLKFRRPRSNDLDAMVGLNDKQAAKAGQKMLADLAEIPAEAIGYLDPADMAKINAWLEPIVDPNAAQFRSGGS